MFLGLFWSPFISRRQSLLGSVATRQFAIKAYSLSPLNVWCDYFKFNLNFSLAFNLSQKKLYNFLYAFYQYQRRLSDAPKLLQIQFEQTRRMRKTEVNLYPAEALWGIIGIMSSSQLLEISLSSIFHCKPHASSIKFLSYSSNHTEVF